jgi:chemotaxis protein CheD
MPGGRYEDLYLRGGDFHFSGKPVRLRTVLGTCVAITMWHPAKRLGGMCHYLLPTRGSTQGAQKAAPGFYADEVLDLFDAAVARFHTTAVDYQVKLLGGGNMFPSRPAAGPCTGSVCNDERRVHCALIGCQNIAAGRRLLAEHGYRIAAQEAGGHGSRDIYFEPCSGELWVRRGAAMPAAQG